MFAQSKLWSNPESKIYQIVKYLLETAESNSKTWSNHLRFLSHKCGLEDPSQSLRKDPLSKAVFKETVKTRITAYYEKVLRDSAEENSRMKHLNVKLLSLTGKPHPSLTNILTSQDVKKCTPHKKCYLVTSSLMK